MGALKRRGKATVRQVFFLEVLLAHAIVHGWLELYQDKLSSVQSFLSITYFSNSQFFMSWLHLKLLIIRVIKTQSNLVFFLC